MVLAGFELGWVIGAGSSYRANTWTPGSSSLTPVVYEGFTQSEQGLEDYNIAECGTSVTAASLGFLSTAWNQAYVPSPKPVLSAGLGHFHCSAQPSLPSLK